MITGIRTHISATLPVVIAAIVFLVLPCAPAAAQCNVVTVNNRTACSITVCVANGGGNQQCVTVAGGSSGSIPAPGFPGTPSVRICGQLMPIPPGTGCLFNVPLANGCCADICYDFVTCTVTATPTAGPCTCP
jgi:hypothetical protein